MAFHLFCCFHIRKQEFVNSLSLVVVPQIPSCGKFSRWCWHPQKRSWFSFKIVFNFYIEYPYFFSSWWSRNTCFLEFCVIGGEWCWVGLYDSVYWLLTNWFVFQLFLTQSSLYLFFQVWGFLFLLLFALIVTTSSCFHTDPLSPHFS